MPDLRSPPRPFDYLTFYLGPAFPSPSGLVPPFWGVELRLEPLTPCRHGSLAHNVEVARKLLLICYHFQYQINQSVFERLDCHLPVNGGAVNGIEKLLKKAIDLLHFARCPGGHDHFPFERDACGTQALDHKPSSDVATAGIKIRTRFQNHKRLLAEPPVDARRTRARGHRHGGS
jgi:hypothetical protein